jgi:hypothetical protein
MAKYFVYPFAIAGARTPIPDPTDPSGVVTWQQGYGSRYTLELGVDTMALAILNTQYNEVLYEATLALQQYQQHGTPDFITSADNLGTPYSYSKYDRVRYDPGGGVQIYSSLINGNTDTPPSVNWETVNNTGVVRSWNGSTTPVDVTAGTNVSITSGTISFVNGSGSNAYPTVTQIQNGFYTTGNDTGTPNALVASPYSGLPITLSASTVCTIFPANANTGAPVTLNWGGSGVHPVVTQTFGIPPAHTITPGVAYNFVYDFALSAWILITPNLQQLITSEGYNTCNDSGAGSNYVATTIGYPLLAVGILAPGVHVKLYPANASSTSAATMNWQGTGVLPIKKLLAGTNVYQNTTTNDIVPNRPALFDLSQDLSTWVLQNPNS